MARHRMRDTGTRLTISARPVIGPTRSAATTAKRRARSPTALPTRIATLRPTASAPTAVTTPTAPLASSAATGTVRPTAGPRRPPALTSAALTPTAR